MDSHTINNKTQEPNHDNSASASALDLLTARNLVVIGNLDEAEQLLCNNEEITLSPAALDLLARIAVQKGQFEQAGQLWKAILKTDPTHEAAKAAIKRLSSPWIAVALIKRIAYLTSLAVILCLSIIGLYSITNYVQQSQLWTATQGLMTNSNFIPSEQSSKIDILSKPASGESQTEVALPVFSIPGCSVHFNKGETTIVFNDGLFTRHCKFNKSANERLSTFARLLRENSPNCRIIIEGHTDSYPMQKNSLYKDNYSLGLQRALTVAELLKSHHQIAGERILVTSMGDTNPPFSGVDYKSKLKNRTVIIRLI